MEKKPRSAKQLASDKNLSERFKTMNKTRASRPPTEKQIEQRRVWASKVRLSRLQKDHTIKGKLPKTPNTFIDGCMFDNIAWRLYFIHKICEDSVSWPMYKLVTDQAPRKANYSLTWHIEQDRLTRCKDVDALAEHRPDLYAHTLLVITQHQKSLEK